MDETNLKIKEIRTKFNSKSIIKQISDTSSHPFKSTNDCILIWLKDNIDENKTSTITELKRITDLVEIFTDRNHCIDYLTDVEIDEKVYLIISQVVNRQFIQLIEDILQLQCIYILKEEKTKEIFPIRAKGKVKGIFSSMEFIFDRLKIDTSRLATDRISFSIVSSTTTSSNRNELDQSFMYSQLIKEIILKIEFNDNSIGEFADFCLSLNENNHQQCENVKKFQLQYKTHSALWWYTKETFVYSLLNEALRTQNTRVIVKMAFFIRDLLDEINQKYADTKHSSKMIVYRGQGMLESEFEDIRKNSGGLISFNNFLSTTTDRDVGQMYAESNQQDSDMIAVLFQMDIDSSISSMSYVHLNQISNHDAENEVLFSMNAVFRIEELTEIKDRLWKIKLIATDSNDAELQNLIECARDEISVLPGWFSMANLLQDMGRFDEAMEIYNLLNGTIFYEDPEISEGLQNYLDIYSNEAYMLTGNHSVALRQAINALEKCEQIYTPGSRICALAYFNVANCHMYCGNFNDALFFAEKALEINSLVYSDIDIVMVRNEQLIGELHYCMGNYSTALKIFEKVYETCQQIFPCNHYLILCNHLFLGESYRQVADYPSALKYLEQARTIGYKYFPTNHPHMIMILNMIGLVYLELGSFSSALSEFEKALNICERTLPPKQFELGCCHAYIGHTYMMMRDYALALSCCEKFLTIFQNCLPENHALLGLCRLQMSKLHNLTGSPSSALSCIEKAMDILQVTFPSDHLYLGQCYACIGAVYRSLGNYSDALSHLEKGLKIQQKYLPANHLSLAETYNEINLTNLSLGNYANVPSCVDRILQIQHKHTANNLKLVITPSTTMEKAHQYAEYSAAGISEMQRAIDVEDSVADKNTAELQMMMNNLLSSFLNMEEATKIRVQSPAVVNPIFNGLTNDLSDEQQYHILNCIASGKRFVKMINSISSNNQTISEYKEEDVVSITLEMFSNFEKIFEIQQKTLPPHDPFLATSYNMLGEKLLDMKFHPYALCYFEKALATIPITLPKNHPLYAKIYNNMAKTLTDLERYQEAQDYAQRAADVAHSSFH